jgi:mono/diheme cytochrome c family protein
MRCLKTGRAGRAVGLGLMFSALGCGGKAADDAQPPKPSYSAPSAPPRSPPTASPSPPTTAPSQRPPTAPLPQQPPGSTDSDPQFDQGPAAARNILLANCGKCHGSALTPTQAQGGINYIDDIDKLVDTGLIVPLSSATSRIIVTMRTGTMPPDSSALPAVPPADIDIVASYIDNPRYWPDVAPPVVVDPGGDVAPITDRRADGG